MSNEKIFGNPNLENPYIDDPYVASLTTDDILDKNDKEVIEILDGIIETIADWDILEQMKSLGEDYEMYNDDEFAEAILKHVVLSMEADRQNLIAQYTGFFDE